MLWELDVDADGMLWELHVDADGMLWELSVKAVVASGQVCCIMQRMLQK